MIILNFFYGLAFEILGLASYLQWRREGDFPLKRELPWLAAFGVMGGVAGWVEMFIASGSLTQAVELLSYLRVSLHLLTGLFLFRFGWGVFKNLTPLPAWMIFVPGVMVVPAAFVISYAATTFITPSPIELPIEIWTRYLLYLPGAFLAGVGFLRQWWLYKKANETNLSRLMFGAGIAFIFEAVVLGLIVPVVPVGPATYYNYDRVLYNAFEGESGRTNDRAQVFPLFGYESVQESTGFSIDTWRMVSLLFLTFFVTRALDIFETIRKQQVSSLENERDKAQKLAIHTQIEARETVENWTNALISITRRIAELNNVDEVLAFIVEKTQNLLNASITSVGLRSDDGGEILLKCYGVEKEPAVIVTDSIALSGRPIDTMLETGMMNIVSNDQAGDQLAGLSYPLNSSLVSAVLLPLKFDGTVIGVMLVGYDEKHKFDERDLFLLESMTDQIAISIEHAIMTTQLQSLSIIQERGRIAREMHDGIAQVLGYLNLQVQTLSTLQKQHKDKELAEELTSMRNAIKTANADVRENILSLRTTLALDTNLLKAIHEYLDEFGIQTSIATNFRQHCDDDIHLSSMSEVQLVCILQEALTNVRKHSRASEVNVDLSYHDNDLGKYVTMTIEDNGIGFKQGNKKRHFGLQTMRERAESVGGELSFDTTNGTGTRINCRLPINGQPKSGLLKQEPLKGV